MAVVAGLAIVILTLPQPKTARTAVEIGFDAPIGGVQGFLKSTELAVGCRRGGHGQR